MAADIDIDVGDRHQLLKLIKHIPARICHNNKTKPHASGIYVTNIPYDPYHKCAAIDYHEAEQRGYFKIDLLNVSVYALIKDFDHYNKLLAQEPQWHLLWTNKKLCTQVIHVGNYFALLKQMQPNTILKMAAFISVIRPGKAHLQGKEWDEVFETVWNSSENDGYFFKKSHALSYSKLVALHLNLLTEC